MTQNALSTDLNTPDTDEGRLRFLQTANQLIAANEFAEHYRSWSDMVDKSTEPDDHLKRVKFVAELLAWTGSASKNAQQAGSGRTVLHVNFNLDGPDPSCTIDVTTTEVNAQDVSETTTTSIDLTPAEFMRGFEKINLELSLDD